jgi:hypothetical protein
MSLSRTRRRSSCVTDFISLWIGSSLGPVERACLKSMLRHGKSVSLYCYAEPSGVPNGVMIKDAASIIPLETLKSRCGDRADLYSDWFRYLLLQRGLGTWLDMDVYVVGEIDGEAEYLFGKQTPTTINNAVLRLPADGAILSALLDPFQRSVIPPWLPWRSYVPMRLRQLFTGRVDLRQAPWGTTSPHALTALARTHGVDHWAEPEDRFYPVPWQRAQWILDPNITLKQLITPNTRAVHLWNECIKRYKNDPAPAGSFLERLHAEGRD